jgi:hypothetical protein
MVSRQSPQRVYCYALHHRRSSALPNPGTAATESSSHRATVELAGFAPATGSFEWQSRLFSRSPKGRLAHPTSHGVQVQWSDSTSHPSWHTAPQVQTAPTQKRSLHGPGYVRLGALLVRIENGPFRIISRASRVDVVRGLGRDLDTQGQSSHLTPWRRPHGGLRSSVSLRAARSRSWCDRDERWDGVHR